jgi:hypothetical protein
MKRFRPTLPYLLALACLLAGGAHALKAYRTMSASRDVVTSWEEHSKSILAALPDDVFVAGYVERADLPGSLEVFDEPEFFITQYGVAPVVLVPGLEQEWIVGNFGGSVSLQSVEPWLERELGEYTVQDLGFGIYLIHAAGR